ncbi:Uncharacterised protein [Enterobacter cloacae]|nr:Uncharacterised protein [Enterobacter cloacae]
MVSPVKKLIDSACAMPGMTCGFTRMFISGSVRTCGRFTTCCQKVPPRTAVCPARTTPSPRQPSCTSPPPITTGVPSRRPLCCAACLVIAPSTVPVSFTGERISARSPAMSSSAGRQSREKRSSMPVVPALDGSTASSPESFAASQSLIMVMVAALR